MCIRDRSAAMQYTVGYPSDSLKAWLFVCPSYTDYRRAAAVKFVGISAPHLRFEIFSLWRVTLPLILDPNHFQPLVMKLSECFSTSRIQTSRCVSIFTIYFDLVGRFFAFFFCKQTFIVPLFNTWAVNRNRLFYSMMWWNALCLCETCRESDKRIV